MLNFCYLPLFRLVH